LRGGEGRASLPPRERWVPPAPWQENQAGGRWEQPPDGNGGHGGRGWDTGGRRVSPRRCGRASPAGRSSQAGGHREPPLEPDHAYGARGQDLRERGGSPRRDLWVPPGCQNQGDQQPGRHGGCGFHPNRQPSPRRNLVPPGRQRPHQPGGFGPLREDWWPTGGQAVRQSGGHATRHDNWGPPGGHPNRQAGGQAGRYNNWGPPGGGSSQTGNF